MQPHSIQKKPPSLPPIERTILEMLLESGELFGLQLVEISNGKLKRGTIYVALHRLQEKGFIDSRQEPRKEGEAGISRRIYRLTPYGLQVLTAWLAFVNVTRSDVQTAEP